MKTVKYLYLIAACLLVILPIAKAGAANRHQFHTSLTRIDFNSEQKLFEITIQLFTHDLFPLLERKSGKRVELEKSTDTDKLILDYLNENFVLTDKKGDAKSLKWVGKETEVDTVRVYLEFDSTENLENYKLKNTLFFESFPEQTNLVVCKYDGKKADLIFKVGDKVKEIIENKLTGDNQ